MTPDGRRFLLGPVEATMAYHLTLPAFRLLADASIANRPCLHTVILDATIPFDPDNLEAAIIKEFSYNREGWPADRRFDQVARSKALLAWEHRKSSREVQRELMFLREGDCRFAGAVYDRGLVVACSGAQDYIDEWFAAQVAGTALMLAQFNYVKASVDGNPRLVAPPPIPLID